MEKYHPDAQPIIDRIKAIDYSIFTYDKEKIEKAFEAHLKALGLPMRPIVFFDDANAARGAAKGAARGAAKGAAWDAAWDAAWGAAKGAAWDAARDAAWGAAKGAARDAARDAARGAARGAARDAAWDAAWGAAVVGTGMIGDTEKVKKAGMIWLPFVDALEAGLFLYFVMKDKIICCPRPCMSIVDNRLHNPKGPAVFWPSGEKYFFLSGVKVPEELVMTPAEKLDPKMLFAEKNAEVRREIVRKIGMERIILKCGATTLDKDGDYELLEFDIGDNRKRPYLKMRNPSIATWHIEGVAPGTKTVEEALHFRKPVKMASLPVDDENGENWYQQGDVVVWSHTAKSLKRCPLVLT